MRIGDAIYQLSEIRRSGEQSRADRERMRYGPDSTEAPRPTRNEGAVTSGAAKNRVPIQTFSGMLREHFVEELRRRDHDGDGRLSWREYGGTREEFERIDSDSDGFVIANDMVREALDRSNGLRDIVSGRWAPVFNSLLSLHEPDNSELVDAVRAGATAVYQMELAQGSVPKPDSTNPSDESPAPEDLMAEFIRDHRDLISLYKRLQDLADRLGRYHRHTPIDALA